jgi:hypothetical protein
MVVNKKNSFILFGNGRDILSTDQIGVKDEE